MKFALLATSEFALRCADAILESGSDICIIVSMPLNARPDNSPDLSPYARQHDIPYREFEDVNSPEAISVLRKYSPDYCFVSWPKLLSKEVLDIPSGCCIGTHPTDIPFNRGRHPLHWLIALGIPTSSVSFFEIDEGVDTGRILHREPFVISIEDTISDITKTVNHAGYAGTLKVCEYLQSDPEYRGRPQDRSKGNVWRKRTAHDVTLDLRMSIDAILRTVRSYSSPFPCVNLVYEKQIFKIEAATEIEGGTRNEDWGRLEAGRIIEISTRALIVKVDDGAVKLTAREDFSDEIALAKYIHPPTYYWQKWPEELSIRLDELAALYKLANG